MCSDRKQILNGFAKIVAAAFIFSPATVFAEAADRVAAGGVALGDSAGGVTDRAFVIAPPHWSFVVEREAGSFLDCGEGTETRATDGDGRDLTPLRCGVTLTETVVIPAAAASARLIVHY
ncbi:MAG: hypothetical protein AAGJ87_03470 [Pseudomonadota bacterium]